MNPRAVITFGLVVLLAGVIAWWWMQPIDYVLPPAPAPAAKPAAKAAASAPRLGAPSMAVDTPTQKSDRIALPTLPPQTTTEAPGKVAVDKSQIPPLTEDDVRKITSHLRLFSRAAQQYMLEKGVTQANYYDIVGSGTDAYLRPMEPVAGEEYESLSVAQTQSQISLTAPDGTNIIFNQ